MNKKGQVEAGLGMIIMVAITLIVGVIFFQAIAQEVGESTNTYDIVNVSLGTVTNGTTIYLTDYKALSSVSIDGNCSGTSVTIASGNYTITDNVIDPTTGGLSVSILPASEYTGLTWCVNATAQPPTYISESGGRAVASLIAIFFALAVAVVALSPTMRSGVLDMMGK